MPTKELNRHVAEWMSCGGVRVFKSLSPSKVYWSALPLITASTYLVLLHQQIVGGWEDRIVLHVWFTSVSSTRKKRKIIYLYRKGSCFQYSWLYVSSCLLLVIFSNWGVAGITHAFEAVTLTGADYSIISLCETNFPKLWYLSMVLYIGSALRKQIYKFVLCLRSQRQQWNIASALQFHCMLNK